MIGFWADFFTFLQVVIGLFLIFIIMLQRGKGGGLVGALGGMGGASAFGPKADVQVLKLTIGLAIAWVFFACVGIFFNRWYAPSVYGPTGKPPVAADTKAAETKTDGAAPKATPGAKKEPSATGDAGPELKAPEKKAPAAASTPAKTEENPTAKPEVEKKEAAPDKAEAPAEKPAAEKPAEEKPAEEKPAEEKPAEEKPAEEKK